MDTLGDRIKEIRLNNKMTQLQFGELFGLSRSHISGIETNAENPSDMFVRFVAYRFGLDYEYLKTGNYSENDTFVDMRYREFRSHLDNFISDELHKNIDENLMSGFLLGNYNSYGLLLTGVSLFQQIGYNSTEYKNYLNCITQLLSELTNITTDAEDLVVNARKTNKKGYNQYKEQASYMSNFNKSTTKINSILNEISDIYFTLCNSNVTFENSDLSFDASADELDF